MNVVEITGRLTRDPEVRYVGDRRFPIVSLNVGVENAEGRWNKDTKKVEVDSGFYKVEVKGDYGVAIMHALSKGDAVYVKGSLSQYRYQKQDTGETQSSISILASFVIPLTATAAPSIDAPAQPEGWADEEEPF